MDKTLIDVMQHSPPRIFECTAIVLGNLGFKVYASLLDQWNWWQLDLRLVKGFLGFFKMGSCLLHHANEILADCLGGLGCNLLNKLSERLIHLFKIFLLELRLLNSFKDRDCLRLAFSFPIQ